MAKEAKVWEIIREAGYEPLENRCVSSWQQTEGKQANRCYT